MTRGLRPVVAIGEAKRQAAAWGYLVMIIETTGWLPFDFAIDDRGEISRVRVRRLKYADYDPLRIQESCRHEIEELRRLCGVEKIHHELWVRGPEREWHQYLILPDSVEMLMADAMNAEGTLDRGP